MAFNRTLQHFTSSQELATIWASGQSYIVNQLVLNNNFIYRCLIANTSSISFSTDLGAGKWVEVSASAAGTKNYITNGDFERNTDTGWSLVHSTLEATTKLPNQVSGSWTSATSLAKSIVSSGQLAGSYSLQLSATAATTAGDMLVTDALTLDLEAQSTVQTFSFYYKVSANGTGAPDFSGTSSNAIGVAIYDATNNQWIQPAGVFNLVQSSGVGKSSGTFQVPSNCLSVRLAVYFPNSTAASGGSPFTVIFDDFQLGPQKVLTGAVISDWVSYTPTISGSPTPSGSNALNSGRWRRVGDSIELDFFLHMGSTGTAGSATNAVWSLPAGLSIDYTKLARGVGQTVGNAMYWNGGSEVNYVVQAYTQGAVSGLAIETAAGALISANNILANYQIAITGFLPIVGWSSNTVCSQDTDTRVVAAQVYSPSNSTTTTMQNVAFLMAGLDTHSTWTSPFYKAPVSGIYRCIVNLDVYAISSCTYLYQFVKNGIGISPIGLQTCNLVGSNWYTKTYSELIVLKAGETVSFQNMSDVNGAVVHDTSSMSFERLSGPATIAASESVVASYYNASGQVIPQATTTTVTTWTKEVDTHGFFNASTGFATIPVSGTYQIAFQCAFDAITSNPQFSIRKNSSTDLALAYVQANLGAFSTLGPIPKQVKLNAGDTIDFRVYHNSVGTIHVNSDATEVYMSIIRVGN